MPSGKQIKALTTKVAGSTTTKKAVLKPTVAALNVGALSSVERRMLELMGKGMSDSKMLAELGLDRNSALATSNSIRTKLNLGPGGSLRDAGKRLLKMH